LTRSLGVYDTTTLPPALGALAQRRAATLGDVVRAGQEAAELIEDEEGKEEAQKLRAVSAEVAAVAEDPTIEKVERVVVRLAQEMNERVDELKSRARDTSRSGSVTGETT
jgi:replicative DNA helicase